MGAATPRPQPGNPRPRLFRLTEDGAVINRFGFNNEGMEVIGARLAKARRHVPVGLNLGANKDSADRASDFAKVLDCCGPHVDFVTVNVSSPNTEKLRDLQGKAALSGLLANVLEHRAALARQIPVFLKIAPDLNGEEIADVAEVALSLKIDAIIATNTSSIALEKIAEGMRDTSRLIGLHFFNPVAQLPLVEVIRSGYNLDADVAKGASFALAIGKSPVLVKSAPGFLVNRVLAPYMMEAMRRHEEGMERERIDDAAKAFGMPVGPLELADQVGLDICKHVAEIIGLAKGEMAASKLARLVAEGKLGKKTGEGFYKWVDGRPQKNSVAMPSDLQPLWMRMTLPAVNEAVACVREGIVADADLCDAGVIFGTGFAPQRGGPINHLKNFGKDKLLAELKALESKHGARFKADAGWANF